MASSIEWILRFKDVFSQSVQDVRITFSACAYMGVEALCGKLDKLYCIVVGGQMDKVDKFFAFTETGIEKKAYRLVVGKMPAL